MAEGKKKEKEPVNVVHQNAQLCETIRKEQRNQKIYKSYGINPYKKIYSLTGKPNSVHDSADGQGDVQFLEIYKRSQEMPQQRYAFPQTEAQEIGWDYSPLVDEPRHDRRLHHQRKWTEVTQYMEAVWRAEAEQQET